MERIDNLELVLDQLQKAFDRTFTANGALDEKLQHILEFSSAIIAIVATITIPGLLGRVGDLYWLGLLLALVMYVLTYAEIKRGQTTTGVHHPITTEIDDLRSLCIDTSHDAALDVFIRAHIFSMFEVGQVNFRKDRSIRRAGNLMFGMVLLVFISLLLGILLPNLHFFRST